MPMKAMILAAGKGTRVQPIIKRTATLGELISQLESIAETIETQDIH